jgi:peroxiredoxin
MIDKYVALFLGLIACLAPSSAFAENIGRIGDPAPPIVVLEWLKGKPVNFKAGTNIIVLEFWAALSPASRAAIPKFNEIQKKFQDQAVVVVGIADDPPNNLKEFLQNEGGQIEYTVAADNHRETAKNFMIAFGQNSIPHAFVIGKDGKVLWHGHPSMGLDKALDDIVSGHYDLAGAIKRDSIRADLNAYQMLARHGDAKAPEFGRKLLADRTNNVLQLCDLAYRIVTDVNNTNRDFALAGEALAQAEKVSSGNAPEVIFTQGLLLFEQGKKEEGIAKAKQAIGLTTNTNEAAAFNLRVKVMEGRMEAEQQNNAKAKKRLEQFYARPALETKQPVPIGSTNVK